jgi:hypothetical protein
VNNNKNSRSFFTYLGVSLAATVLVGCGGDNVAFFENDGPPNPTLSVLIDETNARQVISIHAAATESLTHLSNFGVDLLVRLAESGELVTTLPCDSGSVTVTLSDLDASGGPSAADTAVFQVDDCLFADTGYINDGSVDVLIRNFFARANASSRAKFQYDFSVFMVSRGDRSISVNGLLDAEFIGNSTSQTLVTTTRFGNSIFTREQTPTAVTTNSVSNVSISRNISSLDILTTSSSMSVESSAVGGAFSCSTNAELAGTLASLPDLGELQCNGRSASSARASGETGGAVAVTVDADGDGSYDPVPAVPGSAGNWFDFFQTEFFSFVGRIAGDLPEEEPPVVTPQSAAFDVNDIVASPDGATFYIVNDSGLTTVAAATLTQIQQMNMSDRPNKIAVSDDDSTLWIGFTDAPEIQSVDTTSFTAGGRVPLGAPDRLAARIRVAPGDADRVVVAMSNGSEMVAYDSGVALPNSIDDATAPMLFEFSNSSTIVGHNNNDAEFPASVVAIDATGLTSTVSLREFDILPANDVVLGNNKLFSTTGRVTNPLAASVEGQIKLDQVVTADNQDGIAIDNTEGVVYFYNAGDSLLESYYEDTMVLRSAHTISTAGTFTRLLDAGSNLLLASDSRINIIDKALLSPNANLSPCETNNLSGLSTPGFVAQINCAFNDALYDASRNVIYATLPSFAGVNGNSVAIIDATTGIILDTIFAGSEPSSLSMSADGNTLFVALREATKYAVIDLQASAAAPAVILELNRFNRKPVFAIDLAVSPSSASTVLVAARQEIAVYENGTRLKETVAFYGPVRDVLIDQDGVSAFTQKSGAAGDVLGFLTIDSGGVSLTDEDNTTLRAGSLKLADGKLYDRFGVIADSTSLTVLGNCDASSSFGTRLVEPSDNSNDVFYVDQSADSVLTVCSEDTFTNSKQVNVPLEGSLNSPPLSLEEAGANRLVMTSSDKLIIFQVDSL